MKSSKEGDHSRSDPASSDKLTIYHNPSCTKSRETLALIQANGIQPHVIEYLRKPPTAAELISIVQKLRISPEELVRKTEPVYKEKYAGKVMDDKQWIAALVADPILLQRPIVVRGREAVIGRPPENARKLLPNRRS
jgi:arsenate reductase (glutaredoxin)